MPRPIPKNPAMMTICFFFGLEARFYLLEQNTPFDWFIEKGVYQAAQFALFHEVGQVSPVNNSSLYKNFKSSTGIGLRLIFTSVVLRADVATGSEGTESTVFIGYGF